MKFEKARTTYTIEIDNDQFLALLDSESYATDYAAFKPGVQTLGQKLDKLPGVWDVDYNGHFGNAIHLAIDVEHDNAKGRKAITTTIEKHLKWCSGLKLVDHVAKQRGIIR